MTIANTWFHAPAPSPDLAGNLRRIVGATAEALARAWAGLQSVSRASMLDAARAQRGDAGNSMRIRRLP